MESGNGGWKCRKCGKELVPEKVVFDYLGHTFSETLYRCPHCGYGLYNVCGMMPSCCPNCGEDL